MCEKVFRKTVDEALAFIEQVDLENFSSANQDKATKFIQKTALRADNYDSFVILEGIVSNKSKVHFGNTTQGNFGIIKKVFIKRRYVPLLSDNGLRGVINHQLRMMSKNMGIGDQTCGIYDEAGKIRHECGKCIRCGIMGFLSFETKIKREGKVIQKGSTTNMPHRCGIRSFLPISAEIIQEYHNAIDNAVVTVFTPAEIVDKDTKAANFYSMEYIGPGAQFPVMISMRGMAIAEIGLALMAINKAWYTLGIGRHKNGALTTWEQDLSKWKLVYEPLIAEKEEYSGAELEALINDIKRVAYRAIQKKLFQEYSLAEIKRRPAPNKKKPKKKEEAE